MPMLDTETYAGAGAATAAARAAVCLSAASGGAMAGASGIRPREGRWAKATAVTMGAASNAIIAALFARTCWTNGASSTRGLR